jgi:GDPmannose 4,6-dehydratase
VKERGLDAATGKTLIAVDSRYFRPTEVDLLLGDPRKALERLGWSHQTTLDDLVSEMVTEDLRAIRDSRQPVPVNDWAHA